MFNIQRLIDVGSEAVLPNYIITDVRFPNEADAVKQRKGINIRLQRNSDLDNNDTHISESALDFYKFDYVVDNNGTIEELIDSRDYRIIMNYQYLVDWAATYNYQGRAQKQRRLF